jgi:hypothetical protein
MRKILKVDLEATEKTRPDGYFGEVMSLVEKLDDEHVFLRNEDFDLLEQKYSPEKFASRVALLKETGLDFVPPVCGPGTELKKLLARIGIVASPTCSCNRRAILMDLNGCDWCESNADTIVGWLREEAEKRSLPFFGFAGRAMLRMAIKNARKLPAG